MPLKPEMAATGKVTQLSVGPLLAQAIYNIHNKKSVSALFKWWLCTTKDHEWISQKFRKRRWRTFIGRILCKTRISWNNRQITQLSKITSLSTQRHFWFCYYLWKSPFFLFVLLARIPCSRNYSSLTCLTWWNIIEALYRMSMYYYIFILTEGSIISKSVLPIKALMEPLCRTSEGFILQRWHACIWSVFQFQQSGLPCVVDNVEYSSRGTLRDYSLAWFIYFWIEDSLPSRYFTLINVKIYFQSGKKPNPWKQPNPI